MVGGKIAIAQSFDSDIGTVFRRAFKAGDRVAVRLKTDSGSTIMVSDGSIAAGQLVYAANFGKVTASPGTDLIGMSKSDVGDSEFLEVIRFPGGGNGTGLDANQVRQITWSPTSNTPFASVAAAHSATVWPVPASNHYLASTTDGRLLVAYPTDTSYTVIGGGNTTHYLTAKPANTFGNDGDEALITSGGLEGMVFQRVSGAWVYRTQVSQPMRFSYMNSTEVAAISSQLDAVSTYWYVLAQDDGTHPQGFYSVDNLGVHVGPYLNSIGGGGGGTALPADAVGVLTNDGSGNLSWANTNAQYRHDQTVAATTWMVNHNLNGVVDSVEVYVSGVKVGAQVHIIDNNNLEISFSLPQVGYAIVEL